MAVMLMAIPSSGAETGRLATVPPPPASGTVTSRCEIPVQAVPEPGPAPTSSSEERSEPAPTGPDRSEPAPTEVASSEPAASEPAPTGPPSSDPAPTGSPTDRPSLPEAGVSVRLSGNESFPRGFTVPAGQVWEFDPGASTTVRVRGNVVVAGTLRMRPSRASVVHTLRFEGIDERRIVGGHAHHPVDTDVGIWVVGDGVLDLRGTRRAGWNRTGTDPSWRPADELVVAPMTSGDHRTFAPFRQGSRVPSVTAPDGTVHRAEVANLTRNVRLHGGGRNPSGILSDDGRFHVMFLGNRPQTLRHVELRWVGPRGPHRRDDTDGVLGRYGLHFHRRGDATRGSLIEGVVVRDAGNHAFVPHSSHGITFRDTVAFDTFESAYWWDAGDLTDDTTYDHALAMNIKDYPSFRGYNVRGFSLGGASATASWTAPRWASRVARSTRGPSTGPPRPTGTPMSGCSSATSPTTTRTRACRSGRTTRSPTSWPTPPRSGTAGRASATVPT